MNEFFDDFDLQLIGLGECDREFQGVSRALALPKTLENARTLGDAVFETLLGVAGVV